ARSATTNQPLNADRVTTSTYLVVADSSNYRLLPQTVTKSQVGGATSFYAKVAHSFDATNTVATTDEVWIDADVTHPHAITKRAYDMTTGNVVARWKPQQNPDAGGDGNAAQYVYDARKLFVVEEQSEPAGALNIRIIRDFNYEYGTGTKLETLGPN